MPNHTNVISFPERERWTFHDAVEGGKNLIEVWYENGLSDEGRDNFDKLLKNTAKIKNHLEWGGKFKFLQGEPKNYRIWQLDFIADRRQYRLLGVFRPGRQAILLTGCYHRQKVYTPHDAIANACRVARFLAEGRATYVPRPIREDI